MLALVEQGVNIQRICGYNAVEARDMAVECSVFPLTWRGAKSNYIGSSHI